MEVSMSWRNLFVRSVPVTRVSTQEADTRKREKESVGGFITPEYLLSFAGASTIISLLVRVFSALFKGNELVVTSIVALVVGLIILLINLTDPEKKLKGTRDWLIAILVGLINCIYLIAVSIGVFEVIANIDGVG